MRIQVKQSDIAPSTINMGTMVKTGPLASLENNPYDIGSPVQYPEKLGNDDTKKHVVQFFINQVEQSAYLPTATGIDPNTTKTGEEFTIGNYNDIKTGFKISPERKRLAGSIQLYMPDTVQTSYTNAYQEDDLNDYTIPKYGQALVGLGGDVANYMSGKSNEKFSLISKATNPNFLAAIKDAVNGAVPIDILLKGRGYAINPQVQLLFKATALRTFQMSFLFTPYSQSEATSVNKIISLFKYHAAPEVGNAAAGIGGQFFVLPSTFDIKFLYDGVENGYVNKIDECVLENIEVDYATNGWITYPDGSPVQTRLTLSFKEMSIIDKNKIKQGY